MADTITVNTISGSPVIATDEVGSAHYQYVKVAFGADNTATKAATGAGLPVTLDTLISGEDQTNLLLRTSGGAVRSTVLVNGAVGDSTGTATAVPTGIKVFNATITGAAAVVQTIKIYGGTSSGMAAVTSDLLGTINLNGTTAAAGTSASFIVTANYLFYLCVMSASSGTPTTVVTAMY